jgi:ligand-binding sensor domain-containing protein
LKNILCADFKIYFFFKPTMNLKSAALIVLLHLFFSSGLFAQNIQPVFRHYTTTDGLPSSSIYFVMQDSKGYMWFTTDHGVARYNGYEFKVFSSKDGLEDNSVFYLYEDSKGRIWMLTFSGKIFYYKDGKINAYKYNKASTGFVLGSAPNRIYVDPDDNVYILSQGELKIDSTGKTYREDKIYKKNFNTVLIHEISDSCVLASLKNSTRMGNPEVVYYSRSNRTDSILTVPSLMSRISAARLNKNELIFSIASDFYLLRNDSVISLFKGNFTNIYFLKVENDHVYACTDNGLYVFSDIVHSDSYTAYFTGQFVSGFCKDNENGYWITTRDNGVYYSPDFAVKYVQPADRRFVKPMSLIHDLDHTVYAGYWSGVVTQISGQVEKIMHVSPSSKKVYNLYLDNNQRKIFIAGDASGIISENKFQVINNPINGLKDGTHIKNNFIKHADGFLFNSAQSSLIKIDRNEVVEVTECKNRINCLFETNQGQLLLGCKTGVLLFNDSSRLTSSFNNALERTSIEDMDYFHNQICFATLGKGLIFFDGKKNTSIGEGDGLLSDLVNKIYIHENDIWCATNKGISHIHFTDTGSFKYSIHNITTKEGLPDNEINDITSLNDTLWVATNSGICYFNSRNDFTNPVPPMVYLTSMRINGADTTIQNTLSLSHNDNNLKISFEGISYKSQMDIIYRYVLKTRVDSITGFTKNRDVDFLSLNPGDYTFSILAKNSSGVWSENTAVLSFVIDPPFWQTWWLRSIALMVITAAGFAFYKSRVKKIKEKFSNEKKQASLHLTAMRAQMNPHFIFNVMSSIRNYMQNNDMPSAEKYLTSFAKLVRYTLDNSAVQEGTLEDELEAIRSYATLEMQRVTLGFDFEIQCEDEIDTDDVMLPSLMLQPFVENAIKHGIDRLAERGKIRVEIKKGNAGVVIIIVDNGVGRDAAAEWNQANRGNHISHGAKLTFDRIEAYNKAYNKDIKVLVTDLRNIGSNSTGTRVEIVL